MSAAAYADGFCVRHGYAIAVVLGGKHRSFGKHVARAGALEDRRFSIGLIPYQTDRARPHRMQGFDGIVPVEQECPGGERAARVRDGPEVFKEF